jgi:hypothetical protein
MFDSASLMLICCATVGQLTSDSQLQTPGHPQAHHPDSVMSAANHPQEGGHTTAHTQTGLRYTHITPTQQRPSRCNGTCPAHTHGVNNTGALTPDAQVPDALQGRRLSALNTQDRNAGIGTPEHSRNHHCDHIHGCSTHSVHAVLHGKGCFSRRFETVAKFNHLHL